MAELEERFSQLLADPERTQKAVDMARAILSQRESAPSAPSSPAPSSPAPAAAAGDPPASAADPAGLTAMLSAMLKAGDAAPGGAALPAAAGSAMEQSPLAALLPQLMTLFSGQGDLVKSERLDLLRAMKPYLKESRISSIDRAVKMANMTKAAASAMHLLGR